VLSLLAAAPDSAKAALADPKTIGAFSAPRGAFAIIAVLAIVGAAMTITRRNPISAVMWLVGTFFCLAGTYALLSAHFLAALQVLVYAGAIMTLFVFVVMVLNRDEPEPYNFRNIWTRAPLIVAATGYLIYRLWAHTATLEPVHRGEPPPDFGTLAQIGTILFTDYLFVFEAVSILLLIAVIAAVVVARTMRPEVAHVEPTEEQNIGSELANEPGHGVGGPATVERHGHGHGGGHGHDDHGHGHGGGH
jgi:NADH-quinone oxidoreductase subunit J